MIVVTVPDEKDIIATQEQEGALYFSISADSVIRRTGVVSVGQVPLSDLDLSDFRQRAIVTRMVEPAAEQLAAITGRASAWEGPVAPSVLSILGLSGEVEAVDSVDLHEPTGRFRWRVRRSETACSPVADADVPGVWQQKQLPVQFIKGPIDQVRLVGRLPDGREFPAVFRSGQAWICAFPIFDIGGEFLTFAPLPAAWTKRATMHRFDDMAAAVIGDLVSHLAVDRKMPVVKVGDWPRGYANALCVRHDYDRSIGAASFQELLDYYDRRGLVCSIGFLSYKAPRDQIRALVEHGHEIQIHVWQSDRERFCADVAALSRLAGCPIAGATAHGSERGFRGDKHYDWFEQAGIEYAELFRIGHAPAPIYRLAPSGVLRRSSLMGVPAHCSLDLNNNPEAHQLERARSLARAALEAGAAVVPMNHPDINRTAFYELIDDLAGPPPVGRSDDLGRTASWRAPLRDIVRWTRLTRHDATVDYDDEHLILRFPAGLPQPLGVVVEWGSDEATTYTAAAGEDCLAIPREGAIGTVAGAAQAASEAANGGSRKQPGVSNACDHIAPARDAAGSPAAVPRPWRRFFYERSVMTGVPSRVSHALARLRRAGDRDLRAVTHSIAAVDEPGLNPLGIILKHLGLAARSRVLDVGGAAQDGHESTRFLLQAFNGSIDVVAQSDKARDLAATCDGRVRLLAGIPDSAAVQYDLVLLCPTVPRTLSGLREFVTAFSSLVAPDGYLISHGVLPGVIGDLKYIQPPPPVAAEFSSSFRLSGKGSLDLPPYLAEYQCCGVFERETKRQSFLAWYVLRKRSRRELRARGGQTETAAAATSRGSARIRSVLSQIKKFGPSQFETVLSQVTFEELPEEISDLLRSKSFDSVMFVGNPFKSDARPMKMVQALADFGRRPLAVGVNRAGEYALEEIAGSIPLVLLPNYSPIISRKIGQLHLPRDVGPRYELWMAANAVCIVSLLIELQHKPQLMILHSHDFSGAYVGGNVVRLAKATPELSRTAIKWVHDIHEFVREYDIIDPTLQKLACSWEDTFYPRADALTTVTGPLSDKIYQFYDVKKPPTVIYNCNRLAAKHKYRGPGCRETCGCGGAPLIVHSGSIKPGRGVEYLIRALTQLAEAHLLLITGSTGDFVTGLLRGADELGVSSRLHLHPLLPYDEVAGFIADADAGMIPMEHYGNSDVSLPNKFFDYIMAELPVVSADTDNLRDLMIEWPVGPIFPAGDVDALAAAIGDVLDDPQKYKDAIRSRPDLLLGFAWETQVVKLYDIYRDLARSERARYRFEVPDY